MENNFQITIESDDEDFAFSESKALRKQLQHQDFEEDLEVKQKRSELSEDEAGGMLEASIQILCATPAIIQVSKLVLNWFRSRGKKALMEEKPLKIIIKNSDGSEVVIDAAELSDSGVGDKELLGSITRLLKMGGEFIG